MRTRDRRSTAMLLGVRRAGLALLAPLALWEPSVQDAPRADRSGTARTVAAGSLPGGSNAFGALSGTVRAVGGGGIAGATVCAFCFDCDPGRSDHRQVCALTDDGGAYRLVPLPNEALSVTASADGFLPQRLPRPWRVSAARDTTGVDIMLVRGGVEVSGHVIDVLGGPVVGAAVQVFIGENGERRARSTVSDDKGAFRVWTTPGMMSSCSPRHPATLRQGSKGWRLRRT